MSATLVVRTMPPASWMPQTWVFDGVMRRLAAELGAADSSLASEMLDAQSTVKGIGALDLSSTPATTFEHVASAGRRAFTRAVREGASAFAQPTAYVGYMYQFSELLAMLCCDARAEEGGTERTIVLPRDVRWRGPGCFAALALQHLAVSVQETRPDLTARLLDAQSTPRVGNIDLSDLGDEHLRALSPGLEWMRVRYADGQGRSGYAPEFYAGLGAAIRDLIVAASPWMTA